MLYVYQRWSTWCPGTGWCTTSCRGWAPGLYFTDDLYCTVLYCTRRRIMAELRSMFRASIAEHRNTLDPNHPR